MFLKKKYYEIRVIGALDCLIYIHAKILWNFFLGKLANSSTVDIFSQKQSFLENELICLRGSVVTDIDALDLDDYTLSGFAFFWWVRG